MNLFVIKLGHESVSYQVNWFVRGGAMLFSNPSKSRHFVFQTADMMYVYITYFKNRTWFLFFRPDIKTRHKMAPLRCNFVFQTILENRNYLLSEQVCACACVSLYVFVSTCACLWVHVCVCVCVCVFVCVCVSITAWPQESNPVFAYIYGCRASSTRVRQQFICARG